MDRVRELVHYQDRGAYGTCMGEGINLAILDTGIENHPDLRGRIKGFVDCVGNQRSAYDDNGHGTHVAGIVAGNGKMSRLKYKGIAPMANIYVLKVLDENGDGKTEHLLNGINWVLEYYAKYQIKIVNISVGTLPTYGDTEDELLIRGVERLWDAGIIVIAAAGNYGPEEGSITIPGSSDKIITVGAVDDQIFINKKGIVKYNYSGRGSKSIERDGLKPNILAPGSYIKSCNYHWKSNRKGSYYTIKSGTSMATPVVSGAVAMLLSKHPDLTNEEVKAQLCLSAQDLNRPLNEQGCGLLHIERLLQS